jgi:hypothetical protein
MAPPKAPPTKITRSKDNSLALLGTFTVAQLHKRLIANDIKLPNKALKPELSALWTLATLDLLKPDEDANPELLAAASEWCHGSFLVMDMMEVIKERGLDETGSKWDHVKALILDE